MTLSEAIAWLARNSARVSIQTEPEKERASVRVYVGNPSRRILVRRFWHLEDGRYVQPTDPENALIAAVEQASAAADKEPLPF